MSDPKCQNIPATSPNSDDLTENEPLDFDESETSVAYRFGLLQPRSVLREGERLHRRVRAAIHRWREVCGAAQQVLVGHRDRLPESVHFGALFLMPQIRRAGFRVLLRGLLAFGKKSLAATRPGFVEAHWSPELDEVPHNRPRDLRYWCQLILYLMEELAPEAFPAVSFHFQSKPLALPVRPEEGLCDEEVIEKAAWLLQPALRGETVEVERLIHLLERLTWEEETPTGVNATATPEYEPLCRVAWRAMRDLAARIDVGSPPEPEDLSSEIRCRGALEEVISWCRLQEESPQIGSTRPSRGSSKWSYTQPEVDRAIREYKAERAGQYKVILEGVKAGREGAKKAAQKLFGRNAIARELGVRGPAMVSKSPAWQEIADELQLPRGLQNRSTPLRKRISYHQAERERSARSQAQDELSSSAPPSEEPSIEAAVRKVRRVRLPEQVEEQLIRKLQEGQILPDSLDELLRMYVQQQADSRSNRGYGKA